MNGHPAIGPRFLAIAVLAAGLTLGARAEATPPLWSGYAGNAQHTALSGVASQSLTGIMWQTPVDLAPPPGDVLYIHYGSAMVSGSGSVLVPVKTTAAGAFRVESRAGGNGALLWQLDTDYILPASSWTPVFGPALTPTNRLVMPAAGGTLLFAAGADGVVAPRPTRVAFYGISNYNANPGAFASDVKVCTPITSDALGNAYFGYQASGANPLGLTSGVARVAPDGSGMYVSASALTNGTAWDIALNCAPAISRDGSRLYIAMLGSMQLLVSLDTSSLNKLASVQLLDPVSGYDAYLLDVSSAAPMVAPDDRVYFGVIGSPYNSSRGWMLQFDANLVPSGVPGGFGWDTTPSVVPAAMVPSYSGTSSYLLMCKYNNYAGDGEGGDGVNKIAILDPNAGHLDPNRGASVMNEVLTIAGVTPDSEYYPTYPNAVREWCINSAVVDPQTHSVLVNSEDGKLYRWNTHTNTFTEAVTLTSGIGEAYTPTLIAADGRVLAINNATLFAVGAPVLSADEPAHPAELALAPPWPNPTGGPTRMRFSLASPGVARLEVLDLAGRRIATLIDGELSAGSHEIRWSGEDAAGHPLRAGIYFARLATGPGTITRRFALSR